MSLSRSLHRRQVLRGLGGLGGLALLRSVLPSHAWGASMAGTNSSVVHGGAAKSVSMDLSIERQAIDIAGSRASATTINGGVPGPLIELWEGQEAVLRVSNWLNEDTSLHWHGILLPFEMDGVPGVVFPGIKPRGDLRGTLSGEAVRHVLVSQPFWPSGTVRDLRPTDRTSKGAGTIFL